MIFANCQFRPLIVSALAVIIAACTSTGNSTQDISVSEVLQRNLKAVRGNTQTVSLRTRDIVLEISEASNSLIGRYRAAENGLMRIDVFADGVRVFSEGKDDDGVWEWPADQETPVNVHHEGVGALEHGIEFNLFELAELDSRGHKVELIEREQVRGNGYYVLKITLSDGFETYSYVNEETWLVDISRNYRALHPGIDATKKRIETRYDQWKRIDGILYASRSRDYEQDSDAPTATSVVLRSDYDVPLGNLDIERTYVPDGPPLVTQDK